ncbi:MAG: S24/S26 family peptidase [Planctomycetota bacterium]|jgi:signal peptidase I
MIKDALASGERLIFYSGRSMWPTFSPGDRLFVEECEPATLVPGEVVMFRGAAEAANARRSPSGARGGAGLVVHRVLHISEQDDRTWVRTQGDCSTKPDPKWPGERLVGRVVEVSHVNGRRKSLKPRPFHGWRLRKRLSVRRIARAVWRRLRGR